MRLSGTLPSGFVLLKFLSLPQSLPSSLSPNPRVFAPRGDRCYPASSPSHLGKVHSFRLLMLPPSPNSAGCWKSLSKPRTISRECRAPAQTPGDQSQRVTAGAVFEVRVGMGGHFCLQAASQVLREGPAHLLHPKPFLSPKLGVYSLLGGPQCLHPKTVGVVPHQKKIGRSPGSRNTS